MEVIEDQLGFRKRRGTRDAIVMLRIIADVLAVKEEVGVCFIDWQKVFDWVNWKKLFKILQEIGLDWKNRELIKNLYLEQRV